MNLWIWKTPLKKFMKTFYWCLDPGKLKSEQKLIVLSCPYSSTNLFWRKIGAVSQSTKFLKLGSRARCQPPPLPPPLSQTKGLERGWKQWPRRGRDARFFSRASHVLRVSETLALRARKTLTPHFTFFSLILRKKTDCFAI